jgi:HK97 family phage major capsid protein
MEDKEFKDLMEKSNQAVADLRKTVEDKSKTDAEKAEKLAKIELDLVAFDKANQDLTLKVTAVENEKKEIVTKMEMLEKTLARPDLSAKDKNEKTEEYKTFAKLLKSGQGVISADEQKYLRTDSNVDGGFLAPTDFISEIIKKITEISPIRSVARVRTTGRQSITIPTRTSIPTASWSGEGGSVSADNSKYGSEQIFVHRLTAAVEATIELLSDEAFNVESEIMQDAAEMFAKAEGLAFVSGNGVSKPEGLLNKITAYNSGNATSYTADSLIALCGQLKTGYNPMFLINRKELAFIRSLKDGLGQYLWGNGLAVGKPNTINGYPYIECIDLDDKGANKYPVIFGDIFRAYTIVDKLGMTVVRDTYTKSKEGKVVFVHHKLTGGQTVLPEAALKLKCSL